MGAEVEHVVQKKLSAEAKAKLNLFAVVGLVYLNEVAWVAWLGIGVDQVDDGVDIEIEIVLNWMWDTTI